MSLSWPSRRSTSTDSSHRTGHARLPQDSLPYFSDINAFTAPLPVSLLNEIQRVQAEHGMGGIAFGQRISNDDPSRLKRRRRDHDLSDVEASSEDSESESGE